MYQIEVECDEFRNMSVLAQHRAVKQVSGSPHQSVGEGKNSLFGHLNFSAFDYSDHIFLISGVRRANQINARAYDFYESMNVIPCSRLIALGKR